jgi:hypothetical protein
VGSVASSPRASSVPKRFDVDATDVNVRGLHLGTKIWWFPIHTERRRRLTFSKFWQCSLSSCFLLVEDGIRFAVPMQLRTATVHTGDEETVTAAASSSSKQQRRSSRDDDVHGRSDGAPPCCRNIQSSASTPGERQHRSMTMTESGRGNGGDGTVFSPNQWRVGYDHRPDGPPVAGVGGCRLRPRRRGTFCAKTSIPPPPSNGTRRAR